MDAVLKAEAELERSPREMPRNNPGYDILSKDLVSGALLFIEVKGRIEGAPTVTVTKNEILTCLNKPDQFILALVQVDEEDRTTVSYVRRPFVGSEDVYFDVTSVNYTWSNLVAKAETPS